MTKRVVSHEIKVEKSVKIILGLLVFGVFLNVFAPSFEAKDAFAGWNSNLGTSSNPFVMKFKVKLENDQLLLSDYQH